MRSVLGAASLVAAMFVASAAGATTFDLSSSSGWSAVSGGFQKTIDGITLTVTAGTFDGSTITPGGSSAFPEIFTGYGAGVCTNTSGVSYNSSCHTRDDSHTIDGGGPNELVFLSFSEDVILDGLRFGYFDSQDDFDLFADTDGNNALEHLQSDIDIPNSGYYALTTELISSLFGVGADDKSDSFKLKKVYVTAAPQVPLPAALPLFLSGAAGLGFAGRGRKQRRRA